MFKRLRIFCVFILLFLSAKYVIAKSEAITFFKQSDVIICSPSNQLCTGGNVQLTISRIPVNAEIRWFLNGIAIQGANQPGYVANLPGTYSATATSESDVINFAPVNITISDIPVASFTHSSDEKCATSPIRFTSTSTGTNLVFNWDFGDPNSQKNNISTQANPTHLFIGNHGNGIQSYKVKLTVTNKAGCTISEAETTIKLNQTPSTSLTGSELTYYNNAPYFVQCSNSAYAFKFVNKSNTSNISYRIVWGDKSPDFTSKAFQSVNHTYLPGFYTLFYSVTGIKGCVNTQAYYVYVGVSPQLSVKPASNTVCINQPVLINLLSVAPGATSYKVTYSDGFVKNYPKAVDTIQHYFATSSKNQIAVTSNGTFNDAYTAVIEASTPCGKTTVDAGPIYVIDFPEKPTVISTLNICLNDVPQPLTAGSSSGNQLTWYSDSLLKNKYNGTPAPPTNLAQTISYYVTQTNSTGCEGEAAEIDVNIQPPIENNFIAGDQTLCFGDIPQKLISTQAVKGGNNLFEYQWQISSDNGISWRSDITDNTSSDFTPLTLTGNTRYRRIVTSGSCNNISNEISVTLKPEIFNFKILTEDQYLKPADFPTLISAGKPSGGIGEYYYQWQKSTDNSIWENIQDATALNYLPTKNGVNMYYRRITSSGGCMVISNAVKVFQKSNVFVPTAFSPNGDGANDKWTIEGFDYDTDLRIRVYNRYGQIVLNSKNNTWDGSYNGKQLPTGAYYYIITTAKTKLSGVVTIIR